MPNRSIADLASWKPTQLFARLQAPDRLRPWLLANDSITQKIRAFCPEMAVEILSESWDKPLRQETQALGLASHQHAWIRCVLLKCNERPLVYARTIIPKCLPGNPWYALKQLGNQPLGEVLFQRPLAERSPFIFKAHLSRHWPHLKVDKASLSFARQSCFQKQQAPLLLTEVFFCEQQMAVEFFN